MCKRTMYVAVALLIVVGWTGRTATGQVPDKNGLVMWLDASQTDTIVKDAAGKVSRWNDLSGSSYYAEQTTAANQPTFAASAIRGKPAVDFGNWVDGNGLGLWMRFRNASGADQNINTIRTVFAVVRGSSFLLSHSGSYHFHRNRNGLGGVTVGFWDASYTHANIRNGMTYLNGVQVTNVTTPWPDDWSIISVVTTGNVEANRLCNDRTYRSGGNKYGEILIYDRDLGDAERIAVETYLTQKWFAGSDKPQPENGAPDVRRTTTLSWEPGKGAVAHDVYLGESYNDVSNASRSDPRNVLRAQGQTDTTYDPPFRFEIDTMYYWRVDEVGGPPDNRIVKGAVWSFKAERYSVPIQGIEATASSRSDPNTGPGKTIDGSGLNAADEHSIVDTDMWLSNMAGPQPTWIQYAFDKPYRLDRMLVWNSNQNYELTFGFGAKNVTVDYSMDANDWTPLGAFEIPQASGEATYKPEGSVSLQGVVAKYVRLTINSNWSLFNIPQFGLSEVRFFAVPMTAREPDPADGTTGIPPAATLSWREGREAGVHDVYIGLDPNALVLTDTVTETAYAPSLDLGETYFWRVDEVNTAKDPAVWEGDLWSFSTQPYLLVDDFETYTTEPFEEIWATWLDGTEFGTNDPTNGSIVGADPAMGDYGPALGRFSGKALPIWFNNTGASRSEAVRTFEPWDWTAHGIKTLSLYLHGASNNTGQIYAKINNTKVPYNGKPEDIKRKPWQPWNIDLTSLNVDLRSVTELAFGADGAVAVGELYIDDVRLYPDPGELVIAVDPGTAGLVAHYKFDGNFKDSAGTNDGTAIGDATTTNDPARGQVLLLDGITDAVDVPLLGTSTAITISMWVNSAIDTTPVQFASFFHSDGWDAGDIHWRFSYGRIDGGLNTRPNLSGMSLVAPNVWYHVAATVTPTEWALWIDGIREGVASIPTPIAITLGDGLIGAWLGTDGVTISRGFTGMIDDVRFYNRALSQEELAWLAGRTEPFAKPFD